LAHQLFLLFIFFLLGARVWMRYIYDTIQLQHGYDDTIKI
jgi:hypothetical protein